MLTRVLEPEAMDTVEDARDYDAMDHSTVNQKFVDDFLAARGANLGGEVLDVGAGPARIPILLCRADPSLRLLAIDLAEHMLRRARVNVEEAGLSDRIRLESGDAKRLSYASGRFAAVISNTIVHHIPDPSLVFREIVRVVEPGGIAFIRDLVRPSDERTLDDLVRTYAGNEAPAARSMFADSLRAALTLEEVRSLAESAGAPGDGVSMTSDRHWTWVWKRPG